MGDTNYTPAETAIRDALIALGWTPPNTQATPPADAVCAVRALDMLSTAALDHYVPHMICVPVEKWVNAFAVAGSLEQVPADEALADAGVFEGWEITCGGAYKNGPYSVVKRVDGKGWNGSAILNAELVSVVNAVPLNTAIVQCNSHAALRARGAGEVPEGFTMVENRALSIARMALAHATTEHGELYREAYEKLLAASKGEKP